MSMRRRIWEVLDAAKPGDQVSRAFDIFLLALILLNVLAVILGSVVAVQRRLGQALAHFEFFSVVAFTVEYLARLWSCVADPRYAGRLAGRLRFAASPLALIDLLAILPFYLPLVGIDLRFVRALRLLRVLRVAKLGRYVHALKLLASVLKTRREELILTSALMLLLLTISSCLMYYAEHSAQPEKFSDIPTTMWWAVVTLTTVGYGDVYPVTSAGKFCGAVVAILGIGLFALPTGILGSGFIEEIQKRKQPPRCPHCGHALEQGSAAV